MLSDKPVAPPYEMRTEMTWSDFSNPVNPLGTPKPIVTAMHAAIVDGQLAYKPDYDGREFKQLISKHLGIEPGCMLVGSSPHRLITYAAMAFDYTTVGVTAPCPAAYIADIHNAGHEIVQISNPVSFAVTDPYSARKDQGDFEAALLANPCYPTSRLLPQARLIDYLETCRWVIVDESMIELSFGGESMIPLVGHYDNLIIVRSPSHTFGLPGVPISYLVAHPDTIRRISQFYDATDVNMFAEVLARQFTQQQSYLDDTHEFLDGEIPWMQCMINLIPGINIFPAEGNFVLCEFNPPAEMRLGVTCIEELIVRLQLAGIAVDPLTDTPGLPHKGFFCVSIRTRADNEHLLDALKNIISTIS